MAERVLTFHCGARAFCVWHVGCVTFLCVVCVCVTGESVNIAPKSFAGVKEIALMVYAEAGLDLQAGSEQTQQRRLPDPFGTGDAQPASPVPNGPVLSFFDTAQPGAQTFSKACTLALKYNASLEYSQETAGSTYLVHALDSSGAWQPVDAKHEFDESNEVVRVKVDRTGAFAVMRIPAPPSSILTALSESKTALIVGILVVVVVIMAVAAVVLYRRRRAQNETTLLKGSGTSELLASRGSDVSSEHNAAVAQQERETPSSQQPAVDMVVLHENEREIQSLPANAPPRMDSLMPGTTEVEETLTATLGWANFLSFGADTGPTTAPPDSDASSEASASHASETASLADSTDLSQASVDPGETASAEEASAARAPQDREMAVGLRPDARTVASGAMSPAFASALTESMMEGRDDLISSMFFPRRNRS